MANLFVEDTEILITEKVEVEDGAVEIRNQFYSMELIEKTFFKSSIYSYEDLSVLTSKIKRYGESYFKIVLFSDTESIAWQLVVLSSALDIKVKRLEKDVFIIIGESKKSTVMSQMTFCKIKQSGKVDEVTLNFTKLNNLTYITGKTILLEYEEFDEMSNSSLHVLSLYNYEGKLRKNFYEFMDTDETKFSHVFENEKITVITNEAGKESKEDFDLKIFAEKTAETSGPTTNASGQKTESSQAEGNKQDNCGHGRKDRPRGRRQGVYYVARQGGFGEGQGRHRRDSQGRRGWQRVPRQGRAYYELRSVR